VAIRRSRTARPPRRDLLAQRALMPPPLRARLQSPSRTATSSTLTSPFRWWLRDSPDTSARFGAQRDWADSSGARKLFRKHITRGHGVGAQRCAQVYYDVAADGRIELAWVGEHRPTVSSATRDARS